MPPLARCLGKRSTRGVILQSVTIPHTVWTPLRQGEQSRERPFRVALRCLPLICIAIIGELAYGLLEQRNALCPGHTVHVPKAFPFIYNAGIMLAVAERHAWTSCATP